MIFASDLDRTLIYSTAFVKDVMKDINVIEYKDEIPLTYIAEAARKKLKFLSERICFIPVTSRSLEQFRRLTLFNEDISNKYAVVANGGIILKDNEIDLEWEKIIHEKMSGILYIGELMNSFKKLLEHENVKSARICDEMFIYIVLYDKQIEDEYIVTLSILCKEAGYEVVKNGRKIYILPYFLNKWEPLKYIMEKEKETLIISAGDSILDLPMLKNSHKGLIPYHGELNLDYGEITNDKENFIITEDMGLYCSEELLEQAIKFIS